MSEEEPVPVKRLKLDTDEMEKLTSEDWIQKWKDINSYIDSMEHRQRTDRKNNEALISVKESGEKLKQQQQESTRRENVLVMRLTTKEQEMQDYANQVAELKQVQNPSSAQLLSTLLDPATNLTFQQISKELAETRDKLEQAHHEMSGWKFTPDSQTGKKLMAKCRMLIQENQELGKQSSQGRVAQLEAELALQKEYCAELKASQDELNEFVIQLDEEVEGMQSTIYTLQQQLKESRQRGGPALSPAPSPAHQPAVVGGDEEDQLGLPETGRDQEGEGEEEGQDRRSHPRTTDPLQALAPSSPPAMEAAEDEAEAAGGSTPIMDDIEYATDNDRASSNLDDAGEQNFEAQDADDRDEAGGQDFSQDDAGGQDFSQEDDDDDDDLSQVSAGLELADNEAAAVTPDCGSEVASQGAEAVSTFEDGGAVLTMNHREVESPEGGGGDGDASPSPPEAARAGSPVRDEGDSQLGPGQVGLANSLPSKGLVTPDLLGGETNGFTSVTTAAHEMSD